MGELSLCLLRILTEYEKKDGVGACVCLCVFPFCIHSCQVSSPSNWSKVQLTELFNKVMPAGDVKTENCRELFWGSSSSTEPGGTKRLVLADCMCSQDVQAGSRV